MSEPAVKVTRGPIVESVHRVDVAVADNAGRVLFWLGDPDKLTYWRSCAKPIQAVPVVETGAAGRFGFDDQEIAVMCASHSGEDVHIRTVASILRKIGLTDDALSCGVHPPLDAASADRLVACGVGPWQLHCNCSGKHAAMLAIAVHMGYPPAGYFRQDHPVQRLMLHEVSVFAGLPEDDIVIGVDGCGVPVFGLPLSAMARAFATLASPDRLAATDTARADAARRICNAMRAYPHMVAGTGRFTTALMQVAGDRLVAKSGAEGVYCVGILGQGLGVAVKVEDGNARASAPVVVEALAQMGVLHAHHLEALAGHHHPHVFNHRGEIVGNVIPDFKLRSDH
ncbi:MAG TPA: asparaginase [Firmicutes bacterium]|nr:asparaginase [Bacillota bacterium]